MKISARSRRTALGSLVTLGTLLVALLALTGARGALVSAQEEDSHPTHIHPGTCDTLDPNPAFPLTNISGQFEGDEGAMAGEVVGSGATVEVAGSQTTVETTIDDLLASDFAINVHKSNEEADVYIACGNIAGPMVGDALIVGLGEQNDSGHTGVAILEPAGDGTLVTVYLIDAGGDAAAAAAGGAVTIQDFAFSPAELTIAVGTTVTWTNNDEAPHTATANDGAFDSGRLDEGGTFSFTFDTAGTFDYVCAFHPNMTATITVE